MILSRCWWPWRCDGEDDDVCDADAENDVDLQDNAKCVCIAMMVWQHNARHGRTKWRDSSGNPRVHLSFNMLDGTVRASQWILAGIVAQIFFSEWRSRWYNRRLTKSVKSLVNLPLCFLVQERRKAVKQVFVWKLFFSFECRKTIMGGMFWFLKFSLGQ